MEAVPRNLAKTKHSGVEHWDSKKSEPSMWQTRNAAPKPRDGVGKGTTNYLKVDDFTFEAVKYALLDHEHRLGTEPVEHKSFHIVSVGFEGRALDGNTIYFSSERNTLIGIRGSGKSSIFEAIRHTLDYPLGDDAIDRAYREKLAEHILGSSGRVVIKAKDQRGQHYQIVRILKGAPDAYVDGNVQRLVSIRETVLNKPIYFDKKIFPVPAKVLNKTW
jgi:hypothetical protein